VAWFFFPRILAAVMTLVSVMVLTRALGPTDYGRFNLIMVAGTVAYAGIFAWLAAAISRFHTTEEFGGNALPVALGTALRLALGLVPIVALVLVLVPEDVQPWIVLGLAFCVAHAMHEISLTGLRVQRVGRVYAIVTLLRPLLGTALALLLVFYGYGYAGALIGMTLGAGVTGLWALWRVGRRSGLAAPNPWMLKRFFSFGLPLALVASGSMLFMMVSQSLLARYVGLEAVGIFAAAQSLALRAVGMPMDTMRGVSAVSIFQAFEKDGHEASDKELSQHFSLLMLASVPVVATLVLANDTVARVIFDEIFRGDVADHLPLLAIATFIAGIQGAFYGFAFTLANKTNLQLFIVVGLIAAHCLLSLGLVWALGAIGASWAVLGTSVAGVLAYALIGKRIRPIALPLVEFRMMGLATLAYAPFAILADHSASLLTAAGLLVVGGLAFLATLHIAGHTGLRIVLNGLRRKLPSA
jgi:O-antigen/teichoic acid export membrane protein